MLSLLQQGPAASLKCYPCLRTPVTHVPGLYNGDGVVDLADHERFFECLTGPGGQVRAVCESADLDRDRDADLHDFALLTQSLP